MNTVDRIRLMARILGMDQAKEIVLLRSRKQNAEDGGPGSGNFGHKGRPDQVGGSAKRGSGGGSATLKRQHASAAKSADNTKFRSTVGRALKRLPVGTTICSGKQDDDQMSFRKSGDGLWYLPDSDDGLTDEQLSNSVDFSNEDSFYRAATKGQTDLWDDDNKAYKKSKQLIDRDKKRKQAARTWKERVPKEVLDDPWHGRMIRDYTPDQALGKSRSSQNAYFKAMADALGWQEVKKQGKYDLLTPDERDMLKFIQDKCFGMVTSDELQTMKEIGKTQKDIATQNGFLGRCSEQMRNMYDQLMAKALGVDITPPDLKSSIVLNYLRQHPEYKPFTKLPDQRGYTYDISADDGAIREKLKNHPALRSVPPMYAYAITERVRSMDADIQPYVMRCMDKLKITWAEKADDGDTGGDNCWFDPRTGTITLSRISKAGYERSPQKMADVFWHEFGHFFDELGKTEQQINDIDIGYEYISSNVKGVTSCSQHNGAYNKASKSDLRRILTGIGATDIRPFTSVSSGGTMVTKDGLECVDSMTAVELGNKFHDWAVKECVTQLTGEQWEASIGAPQEPKHDDYIQTYFTPKRRICRTRQRFPGAREKYQQALIDYDDAKNKFIEEHGGNEAYWKEFSKHQERYDAQQKQVNQLCDIVGQMSLGTILPIIYGTHTDNYYRRQNKPVETSAEVFRYLATGKTFTLKCMQKIMPDTYQLMINAIKYGGQY